MAEPSGPSGGTAEPGKLADGIAERGRLADGEVSAVLALASAAADEDGVAPLSEHVMLHLRGGGDPPARNLLRYEGGDLAGYAHLDPTDPVQGPSGELVVHPRFRHRGLGSSLVAALVNAADGRPIRLWAHGELPAATRLATAAGFERIRSLWQMRRSLQAPIERPEFAAGITVRAFEVGRDEAAWTELNRRAFVRHPEQGTWTRDDLEQREREGWFDPDGFFLAEREGRLVGFHWTKIHGAPPASGAPASVDRDDGQAGPDRGVRGHAGPDESAHGHEAMGEVYVVGVDPAQRGTGLGRALTLTGLRYLRSRGLYAVMLYVDESNTAAIRLYESLGFTHWETDVMFGHPGSRQPDG